MFYSIPCVRNMIAAGQMDFVGKTIRGLPDRPSCNMITACCDHKRRAGRPQTTGKNFLVENLCLLFQDVPTIQIDRYGSLQSWIHEASNKNIGVNWSTVSFTLLCHSWIAPTIGGPSHPGKHAALRLDARQPMTLTTVMTTHLRTQKKMNQEPHYVPPPHHHVTPPHH